MGDPEKDMNLFGVTIIVESETAFIAAGPQMKPENLSILSNYGIIQERFAALATDAIRGNLLEYCGYKTQLLEFVDFAHTPKNILIRAMYRPATPRALRTKKLSEAEKLMEEFRFEPTLYKLVKDAGW
jgi:hypothetical protein